MPRPGVAFSASPASLTLAAGASGKFTVTMVETKGIPAGFYQAQLTVSAGATPVAHAAVFTLIK